ncbi:YceI family protein [Fodinicola feengrottensis]|uniref:YceI family protein n=1 Tax=Fodinicola feengrottensis TaxID=435914 RepID=UPI0013D66FBA|nr:YceI family protein [Fodinicola feengrottensis]
MADIQLGPAHGRLLLRTRREGLAAGLGHDLTIELTRWSATVRGETAVTATIELDSLQVREGSGGALPLTDTDRRDIGRNARKVLRVDSYGTATYRSTHVRTTANGYQVDGSLTLAGATRSVQLTVTTLEANHYRVIAEITQSDFGIKPYAAFFLVL